MATVFRQYPEVPVNVEPDVPHHVNLALREVDKDMQAEVDRRTAADRENLATAREYADTKDAANRTAWADAVGKASAKAATDAAAAKWSRGALTAAADYRELGMGTHLVATASTATALGLPFGAAGNVTVSPGEGYGRVVEFATFGAGSRPNQVWQTERSAAGVWTAWKQTNAAMPLKYALPANADLDVLEPGAYWVNSYDTARQIKGLPSPATGDYLVWPGATPRHEWITTGLSSRPNEKWQREKRVDGTFTEFWRTDVRAVPPVPPLPPARFGSGFKVVPLAVTLDGNGGASATTRTAREERYPLIWHAPISRIRVHIGNQNLRTNERNPGPLAVGGLFIGEHAGGGNCAAAPRQVADPFTTPADGSEWVSPWLNVALTPGTEYLLNFGFTAAEGTQFFYHNGQSYASDLPGNAGNAKHGGAGTGRALLDVWIEAETYATTPVIATVGSSSSVGVGAGFPAQENVASLLAKRLHALPMHYGGAGDTMGNAANFDWARWTRWAHLAKPDAVLNFMGSNDVFEAGMTLPTLQARYAALNAYLSANISPNIYLTTVTPRNTVTGAQEDLRRQFNAWLGSQRDARDVFDFAAAVSADNETLLPAYDSGDGYHFSTAGHEVLAAAVDRPITTPPVLYATI